MNYEYTFCIIKPNSIHTIGGILSFIENNGFFIEQISIINATRSEIELLYNEHINHPQFNELVDFMISGKIAPFIISGLDSIACARRMCGYADPNLAQKNTIRMIFGKDFIRNSIHSSKNLMERDRELSIFYPGFIFNPKTP